FRRVSFRVCVLVAAYLFTAVRSAGYHGPSCASSVNTPSCWDPESEGAIEDCLIVCSLICAAVCRTCHDFQSPWGRCPATETTNCGSSSGTMPVKDVVYPS